MQYKIFYSLLTAPQTVSNTTLKWPGCNGVHITCNTSNAYHLQHVMCHVVRRDSSAIKFDRVEIAFIWAYFIGWNHWRSFRWMVVVLSPQFIHSLPTCGAMHDIQVNTSSCLACHQYCSVGLNLLWGLNVQAFNTFSEVHCFIIISTLEL